MRLQKQLVQPPFWRPENESKERDGTATDGRMSSTEMEYSDALAMPKIKWSGFYMSGKSQIIGDFAVSRLSQVLPICRENR